MTPQDYSQAKVYAESAKKKYEDSKNMFLKWHKKSNEVPKPCEENKPWLSKKAVVTDIIISY
ncbi:MAG: hypothetical protein HFK07_03960 [Clostridia bacterium]|nr:hypothetical protein [Clostridia bacterium]